ncbi:MAG: hypothetical protein KIT84_29735 [Labilithrix sp.]|nr:hypothetical protein [Labilithrix sp.]MCW5815245.1 hypothetical protein [Labilithrix sp.]
MTSYDADDVGGASQQRSQLRKRYDLGGASSGATSPHLRETARPRAPSSHDENTRPTIPTPRPRLALGAIPRRLVDDREMLALPLDHRAAFVLMHIDGKTPLRTLVDVTGMLPEEVVTLVERLLELKAIAIL